MESKSHSVGDHGLGMIKQQENKVRTCWLMPGQIIWYSKVIQQSRYVYMLLYIYIYIIFIYIHIV